MAEAGGATEHGMMYGMKNATSTTIDSAGRLVIPKPIREQAGFTSGMALEIRCRDGRVEIEPAPRQIRVVQRGRVYVAAPLSSSEPLTSELVRETQDSLRARHDVGPVDL